MAPYMQTVYEKVSAVTAPSGKDLFQLNEAIFNVERDDDPSPQLAGKLFAWIQKLHREFLAGKIGGTDENFFYDYLGLLGTMQNQHFFSGKQVQRIQGFMHEGLAAELGKESGGGKAAAAPAAGPSEEIKGLLAAVKTIQTFKLGAGAAPAAEDGEGKKKKRSRGKKGEEAAEEAKPAEEAKEKKARKPRKKKGAADGEEKAEAPAKAEGEEKADKPKRQRNRKGKKEGAAEGGE